MPRPAGPGRGANHRRGEREGRGARSAKSSQPSAARRARSITARELAPLQAAIGDTPIGYGTVLGLLAVLHSQRQNRTVKRSTPSGAERRTSSEGTSLPAPFLNTDDLRDFEETYLHFPRRVSSEFKVHSTTELLTERVNRVARDILEKEEHRL